MSLTADIEQLYVAFFNRPADPAGLAYWTERAADNGIAVVAEAFGGSPEYAAQYAGLNTAQTIDTVYLNLFGRHAEADGLAYWSPLLDSKTVTLAQIAAAIAGGAQGSDLATLGNKVSAATVFTSHLDTPQEVAAYANPTAFGVVRAWLAGVSTDATLAAASAAVDLTILQADPAEAAELTLVTAASPPPPTTLPPTRPPCPAWPRPVPPSPPWPPILAMPPPRSP